MLRAASKICIAEISMLEASKQPPELHLLLLCCSAGCANKHPFQYLRRHSDLQEHPVSEAQHSAFSSIASGAVSLQLQLTTDGAQPSALNGSVPAGSTRMTVQLLRCLGTAVQRGASLRYANRQSRLEAALDVRRLHASLEAGSRQQSAADAVIVILHLLQPLIADAFGLGNGGAPHSLRNPEENAAGASEQPEATEQVKGAAGLLAGELGSEWRFLLGNTLLKLLDRAGLPRFGGSGSEWPNQGLRIWDSTAGRSRAAGNEEIDEVFDTSGVASQPEQSGSGAGQAVGELTLLMLGELMEGVRPDQTRQLLQLWAEGQCGGSLQEVGEAELQHALLAGFTLSV